MKLFDKTTWKTSIFHRLHTSNMNFEMSHYIDDDFFTNEFENSSNIDFVILKIIDLISWTISLETSSTIRMQTDKFATIQILMSSLKILKLRKIYWSKKKRVTKIWQSEKLRNETNIVKRISTNENYSEMRWKTYAPIAWKRNFEWKFPRNCQTKISDFSDERHLKHTWLKMKHQRNRIRWNVAIYEKLYQSFQKSRSWALKKIFCARSNLNHSYRRNR